MAKDDPPVELDAEFVQLLTPEGERVHHVGYDVDFIDPVGRRRGVDARQEAWVGVARAVDAGLDLHLDPAVLAGLDRGWRCG